MSYLDDLGHRTPATNADMVDYAYKTNRYLCRLWQYSRVSGTHMCILNLGIGSHSAIGLHLLTSPSHVSSPVWS